MKKILVVSDIHSNIERLKEILEIEKDVDLRVYAGDLQLKDTSILDQFDYVVKGNSDYPNNYEEIIFFNFEGTNFLLTHGHLFGTWTKRIDFDNLYNIAKDNNVKVIIHGHDHIKANETKNGILRFNPGSPTDPRDGVVPSYGIITIDKNKIEGKHK